MKPHLPTAREVNDILGPYKPEHNPVGRFLVWDVNEETGAWSNPVRGRNTYLYTGSFIAARCIGLGDATFKVGTMYMEFKNAAPPISVPTVNRADTIAYYNSLVNPSDYLRVPIVFTPTISVVTGNEAFFDTSLGEGDRLTFFAQSSGSTGVLGRTFSDAVSSTVIGVALAATPVPADRTKDYLLSRGYLPTAPSNLQKTKLPNSQIGITWTLDL